MGCNRKRLPSYPVIPSSAQSQCHPIHLTPSGSPCRTDQSQRPTTPGTALAEGGKQSLSECAWPSDLPQNWAANHSVIDSTALFLYIYINPYDDVHAWGCLCRGVSLHLALSLISSAETMPALTGLNSYYSSNMFDQCEETCNTVYHDQGWDRSITHLWYEVSEHKRQENKCGDDS